MKSCDPNISKAFSELLRSSNAGKAEKLLSGEETPTTTASSACKDDVEISKDDSISGERDDIHFEPVAQLPEQVRCPSVPYWKKIKLKMM